MSHIEQKALIVTDAPASVAALNRHLGSPDHWLVKHTCPMPSSRSAHGGGTYSANSQATSPTCLVVLERTIES